LFRKIVVKAYLDVSEYGLKCFFEENKPDYDHSVLIRRERSFAGKNRALARLKFSCIRLAKLLIGSSHAAML